MWKFLEGAAVGAGLLAASAGSPVHADSQEDHNRGGVQHVLLISIDGMHALDFINCAQGISGFNGGQPYCPNLAELAETGVNLSGGFGLEAFRFVPRTDGAGERRLAADSRRIL